MPLDPRDRETLRIFASGGVSAIPAARVAVDRLLSELDRLQSDRSMRMERLREELTCTETALNALAFAAGVDYGTARADLERAAAGPEIDGVSGAYRYATSLVERAVDRAGRKAEAELRARWTFTVRDGRHVWISMRGAFALQVLDAPAPDSSVGWHVSVEVAPDDGWGGPETGESGKAAAEAAWRRVCGLEAENPGA